MSVFSFASSPASLRLSDEVPLETMRTIAVLLLVSYHVIGPSPLAGLEVDYPHALRMSADFLLDVRMPIFAFLAGYIYAIRPPELSGFGKFVTGKFRRIFLPGMVAAALFLIVSNVVGTDFARPLTEAWQVFFTPYAHFWFLQSICLIFVVYGLVDALLSHRYALVIFGLALIVHELRPFPWISAMSWNGATYLLPYFMLGVLSLRYKAVLVAHARAVALLSLAAIVLSTLWNIQGYLDTGSFQTSKRDLQSIAMGMGTAVFLLLCLPRVALLEKIRPYALTIYLYHVFATSFTRRLCGHVGLEDVWLTWALSMSAGLIMPIALHLVVLRLPSVIRRPVLGH